MSRWQSEQCPDRPPGRGHEPDESRRTYGRPAPCRYCGVEVMPDEIPPQLVYERYRWAQRPMVEH